MDALSKCRWISQWSKLALWVRDIITPKNNSRRLSEAIISRLVGPNDPKDTLGSLGGDPTGSKEALRIPSPDYHVLFT